MPMDNSDKVEPDRQAATGGANKVLRIAADIGGTFTDVAALDEVTGHLRLGKSLSTPRRLMAGISAGVRNAEIRFGDAKLFLHGSTIAINTLIERTGAKTGLLTTKGFRDAYEIGRINRPDAYNLFFKKHVPLVPRSRRYEIIERMRANGEVLVPLDEASVHAACDRLIDEGVEAVAIVLLHCYANSAHERRVAQIVRERLPGVFIATSHELSREYREFERSSTAAANAYIGPRVSGYLAEMESEIRRSELTGPFLIVQSSGGLYESSQARQQCVRMLESGPAAGVIGALALCRALDLQDAVAFDMGGTTAKAGVIWQGQALTTSSALVGGYNQALPIQIPMIDIFEVGTGGGSVAEVGLGNSLHVGPRSAGAEPGPACYGLGGEAATVTDANLLLGRLDPKNFLGGTMPLDAAAATTAIIQSVGKPLGLSPEDAASGILEIAVTKMSYAVKAVSTERGLDAAAFPMIAYGGAGPLHAVAIAKEIGIRKVIIPQAPGHFCAFGMLHADLRYDQVATWFGRLQDASFVELQEIWAELVEEGRRALESSRVTVKDVEIKYAVDVRYVGQEHSVTVDIPVAMISAGDRGALKRQFDSVHDRRYGTCAPGEPAEITALRATVIGILPRPAAGNIQSGSGPAPDHAERSRRPVYFRQAAGFVNTPVYDRKLLRAGNVIGGPALIEEHASTTVLFPGDSLEVDGLGNLVISVGHAQ